MKEKIRYTGLALITVSFVIYDMKLWAGILALIGFLLVLASFVGMKR